MAKKVVGFLTLGEPHTEYIEVLSCLSKHGIEGQLINLNQSEDVNWAKFSLINVRECRGYHLVNNVVSKIEDIAKKLNGIPLVNSLDIIRAGLDKGIYLKDLAQDGVNIIPTIWLKRGDRFSLKEIIGGAGWNDFVIKPTVASKCWNIYRVNCNTSKMQIAGIEGLQKTDYDKCNQFIKNLINAHDVCIQKFMPEILNQGELSFIFIGGKFSHAVKKRVARDNWLAHEAFGGVNLYYEASSADLNWAQNIYLRLTNKYGDFLYARVDGVPDGCEIKLLECELVVPRLFLKEGQAFNKYVTAIKQLIV